MRAGHTEAGCDLAGIAGLEPASVICEIMNDDGTMARLPELIQFANEHGLKIGTIADLIHFRAASETLVERMTSKTICTPHGEFVLYAYRDQANAATHLALVKGKIPAVGETLVRVHQPLSVLDFLDPSSRSQAFSIDQAQAAIANHGHGVIVLMHLAENSESLLNRLTGKKTITQPKWDPRTYGIGAQILRDLGVTKMCLLASPNKMPSMTGFGLEVSGFKAAI